MTHNPADELEPGTGGLIQHIHCPDREGVSAMTRSSVKVPGFGDQISRTAQQVRSLTRNPKAVHRLLAAIPVPGGGGRAYRTACHKELPTQQATLTTAAADCAGCKAAL